jgi:hypothetical protein
LNKHGSDVRQPKELAVTPGSGRTTETDPGSRKPFLKLNKEISMTNTQDVQGPVANPDVIGNEVITTTINQVKDVWRRGAKDRLKLGELFSQLRSQVEAYRKDAKTGLTYNQAVAKTGVPRGTAERYREMYETVKSSGIQADVFLALADKGCNLAANRTTMTAGILADLPSLKTLDITDDAAVKKLAEDINRDYPVISSGKEPTTAVEDLEALLRNLETMPTNPATTKMIADTKSEIIKAQQASLLTLAIALAPFMGKDKTWAEGYVERVGDNSTRLRQRYAEAVKFAKSATFLLTDNT